MENAHKTFDHRDIMNIEKAPRLKMINAISGFKSANLLGTASAGGQENVAVFSSVIHLGSNPPFLGFITRPQTVPRQTYQNIRDTDWFTVNHVNDSCAFQKNSAGNERAIQNCKSTIIAASLRLISGFSFINCR